MVRTTKRISKTIWLINLLLFQNKNLLEFSLLKLYSPFTYSSSRSWPQYLFDCRLSLTDLSHWCWVFQKWFCISCAITIRFKVSTFFQTCVKIKIERKAHKTSKVQHKQLPNRFFLSLSLRLSPIPHAHSQPAKGAPCQMKLIPSGCLSTTASVVCGEVLNSAQRVADSFVWRFTWPGKDLRKPEKNKQDN